MDPIPGACFNSISKSTFIQFLNVNLVFSVKITIPPTSPREKEQGDSKKECPNVPRWPRLLPWVCASSAFGGHMGKGKDGRSPGHISRTSEVQRAQN